MVATRNQQNVIARSFGSVPNGSMPSYFGANELGQYVNMREFTNPVSNRKNTSMHMASVNGFNGGFMGAGQFDTTLAVALAGIYIGLGFPGYESGIRVIKKVVKRPQPVLQSLALFSGVGLILYRQFKTA